MYKKDGWYYLLISEAGTGHHHAVSIARSKSLTEPFEGYKGNPILTHRHLGYYYPIVNVGHPDIVETQNGEWWMVCLASRICGGYYRNLGRETFLVPFIWEDGWPVVNPAKGILEETFTAPNLPADDEWPVPAREDFDDGKIPMHFLYLRNPQQENYSTTAKAGYLQMKLSPDLLSSTGAPSYLCRRQQSFNFLAGTSLTFEPAADNEQAGLAIYQSQSYNYQLLVGTRESKTSLCVLKTYNDKTEVIAEKLLDASFNTIQLRITQNEQDLAFLYSTGSETFDTLADHVDARMLSTDVAGGFVGNTIGLYATSNGKPSETCAYFDYFTYENL